MPRLAVTGCFVVGTISLLILGGLGILGWGLNMLVARLRALPRLHYTTGTVTAVEEQPRLMTSSRGGRQDVMLYKPTISYIAPSGQSATFTSESADSQGYSVGQTLEIAVDSDGRLEPMLRKDLWYWPVVITIAGTLIMLLPSIFAWLLYTQRSGE